MEWSRHQNPFKEWERHGDTIRYIGGGVSGEVGVEGEEVGPCRWEGVSFGRRLAVSLIPNITGDGGSQRVYDIHDGV